MANQSHASLLVLANDTGGITVLDKDARMACNISWSCRIYKVYWGLGLGIPLEVMVDVGRGKVPSMKLRRSRPKSIELNCALQEG